MQKFKILVLFTIVTTSLLLGPMAQTAADPLNKQVTLEDLGVLQLAAHDLFNVNRCLDLEGNTIPPPCKVEDFENGKLDLSTLFTDMKTGLPFSDEEIAMGGEPRNRENIMLFTVASSLGQMYLDLKAVDDEKSARQQTVLAYHNMLDISYPNTFDESMPNAKSGCATMTENLALRTIHDLLPGNIIVNEVLTPVLDPSLHGMTLSEKDMAQLSAKLDNDFDDEFLDIHIIIPPDIDMTINLLELDSSFASQFNTAFTFEEFMAEIEDGFFNPEEEGMKQVRSLFAKGLGDDCYVGGELLPIETIALLLAGAQSFSWMIPLVLAGLGIGLVLVRRK